MDDRNKGRIRAPVKRDVAQRLVLLSLISFAGSVIVTRLFLAATGYPKIGGGTLHVAHVLWGGLLLFIASLLPLILANRWALSVSAVLSGVGVGLFIDEVGKFITMSNDYFFPAAAPIIYAFFLITVFVYMNVRRAPTRTPRSELYRIFEGMTEVLDQDLDSRERKALEARLRSIVDNESSSPNLQRLVQALLQYLEDERLSLASPEPELQERIHLHIQPWMSKYLTRTNLKWFLVAALAGLGVLAMMQFLVLVTTLPAPGPAFEALIQPLVTRGAINSAADALWFFMRTLLEGITGLLLLFCSVMLASGRERRSIDIAIPTMVVWLTGINLIVFYLDQFGATAEVLLQFSVLITLMYYRNRFHKTEMVK